MLAASAVVLHGFWIVKRRFRLLDEGQRQLRIQRWSRHLLRALGVAVEVRGQMSPGAKLVVCNHVSWLDIVALHAVCPQARFVAKSDVHRWPLIGAMAAAAGTLFVDRHRKRQAAGVIDDIANALREGATVVVFPEGTTSAGHGVLEFHSSLLHGAVLAGCDVQPVALRYVDAHHDVSPLAPYIDDTSLAQSLWRICQANRLVAHLHMLPQRSAPHADRRSVSRVTRQDIAAHLASPRTRRPAGPGPVPTTLPSA